MPKQHLSKQIVPAVNTHRGLATYSLWRIRLLILAFLFSLASLGLFLVKQAFDQLQWESFHRYQSQAIEFSDRIERELKAALEIEYQRSFGEYSFTVARGNPGNVFVQRSPLSNLPQSAEFSGFVGYFQLDDNNHFSTPLLPEVRAQALAFGLSDDDIAEREARQSKIKEILVENGLLRELLNVSAVDSLEESARIAETQARASKQNQKLDDFKLDDSLRKKSKELKSNQQKPESQKNEVSVSEMSASAPARLEKELLSDKQSLEQELAAEHVQSDDSFSILESRIGGFSATVLESGHVLFFRHVWQENQRYMQGFLLKRDAFIEGLIAEEYQVGLLADMSTLAIVWQNQLVQTYSGRSQHNRTYLSARESLGGSVLHKQSMPTPLNDWEMLFTIDHLPAGAGARVILFAASSFLFILLLGCILIYRLLLKHIFIARQQQDFVSSISHELKTPLTSIRMYGEMLKEGWVNEEKKKEYYDFIFHESERLTRLINNILQLARMTRSELALDVKTCQASELVDLIRSTISTQVDRAGFSLELNSTCKDESVAVDADLFLQVIINLVDNALKFARKAEDKRIVLEFIPKGGELIISVRDFGPGIPQQHLQHIFTMFYRVENELTRETKGTGIGLALVSKLLELMQARIEVENCGPGARFTMHFPLVKHSVG